MATFLVPVVLHRRVFTPIAVLLAPVVLLHNALNPTTVLPLSEPPPIPTLTKPFTSKSPFVC
jgi:hypothetical protein